MLVLWLSRFGGYVLFIVVTVMLTSCLPLIRSSQGTLLYLLTCQLLYLLCLRMGIFKRYMKNGSLELVAFQILMKLSLKGFTSPVLGDCFSYVESHVLLLSSYTLSSCFADIFSWVPQTKQTLQATKCHSQGTASKSFSHLSMTRQKMSKTDQGEDRSRRKPAMPLLILKVETWQSLASLFASKCSYSITREEWIIHAAFVI